MEDRHVYKILSQADWQSAQAKLKIAAAERSWVLKLNPEGVPTLPKDL